MRLTLTVSFKLIFKVTKCPASLSKEPKWYYTLLFTGDKNAPPATMRTRNRIISKKACVVLFGSFDRSAVNLSNLKIILNYID